MIAWIILLAIFWKPLYLGAKFMMTKEEAYKDNAFNWITEFSNLLKP